MDLALTKGHQAVVEVLDRRTRSGRRTNPTTAIGRAGRGSKQRRMQDALEQVRVDVLGRKGSLAQFNVGKLAPEERKVAGKALNAAKQALEGAFETQKQAFAAER